ncbi:MAG: helix-turn-helix transcriptional regulator [Chloroflexaceae bacterium]|nr:helix-turn-helix transcriptional regulator [Chloroflexaceae bacterium]
MKQKNDLEPLDGGIAVGAYLRYLRDKQGLHAKEIAEKIGTNQTQVWRIENWHSDVRSSLIFRHIRVVGGDANDVELLINNPAATVEDGEALAKLRLSIKKR